MSAPNLTLCIPSREGVQVEHRATRDVGRYLDRNLARYPEGTLAVFFTGGGTRQYRRIFNRGWELVRQTVGP